MFNEQVSTRTDHIHTTQNGDPELTCDIATKEQVLAGMVCERAVVLRGFLSKLDAVHPWTQCESRAASMAYRCGVIGRWVGWCFRGRVSLSTLLLSAFQ